MSEWISVKDSLPDEFTDILALCTNLSKGPGFDKDEVYCAIDRFCKWSDSHAPSFRTDRFYDAKITHWMPLPEFPKEDE